MVISCVLFVIIIGANLFSFFMVQTHLPELLLAGARALDLSALTVMILIILAYIVLGCFLEGIGMVLITVPVFLPLVIQFGYDPIWFAIIVVIMVEVGLIHPPVGMNLFVIQAQAPDDQDHQHLSRHHAVPGGAVPPHRPDVPISGAGAVAAAGAVRPLIKTGPAVWKKATPADLVETIENKRLFEAA